MEKHQGQPGGRGQQQGGEHGQNPLLWFLQKGMGDAG